METVKPSVKLLGFSRGINGEGPEYLVACAGKLCYSKSDIQTLSDNLDEIAIKKFINKLLDLGHESPLEHASFTFGIEGISRSCSHQIVRHRIASFSQQSQRYVDLNNSFKVIIPPEIDNVDSLKKIYMDSMLNDYKAYIEAVDILKCEYIKNGMNENNAHKKALEDARFMLPNACETKIIMTMNVRSLLNFFRERCCNRAQWEIRGVANQMLDLCLEISPILFQNAGPSCVFGKCSEGSMSCKNPVKAKVKQLEVKNDR